MRVPEIDSNRLLVADLGSSSIPNCSDAPEIISWETMAETQQEQRAGVVCITGAPERDAGNDFPDFASPVDFFQSGRANRF